MGISGKNAPFPEWSEKWAQFKNDYVHFRAFKTRRRRYNTQTIRQKLVMSLQELYDSAISTTKDQSLKPKQREAWARLAAYIAQTMNTIMKAYDEIQVEKAISELKDYVETHLDSG